LCGGWRKEKGEKRKMKNEVAAERCPLYKSW